MSGEYSPPPEQMPQPPTPQPPAHHPSPNRMPPACGELQSLAHVELNSILSSLARAGEIEGGTFLKAEVADTDVSIASDLAFGPTTSSPLASFDAQVLGGAGHGSGDSGAFLGKLITAGTDISTDLLGGDGGSSGHERCLCGEVLEPVVATALDHVGDLLT